MFALSGPIGAIQSPNGNLELGHIGTTNCIYFSFKSDADFVPTVIYNPDELADLIKLAELAVQESKTIPKGSILRLGSMAAKPIILRLALVHPPQQPPFLLLRLLQGNWAQDISCSPKSWLQLIRMGQVDGPDPLAGRLEREEDGAWIVDGERLEVLQGLSPGRGNSGEYIHPDDVEEGEEIETWPFTHEGKKLVATFRLKATTQREAGSKESPGETADRYLARGQNHLARMKILELAKEQLSGGGVTAPWAAKASLSYLLAELADGNDESAQQIWLGKADNKFLQIGIECMEAGQSSTHDLLIFHQISAYFHSLNPDIPKAFEGVDHFMKTVCEGYAQASPRMLKIALDNWYLYLKEVCEGEPPVNALAEWTKAVETSGAKPRPKVISFPNPDTWKLEEKLIRIDPAPKGQVSEKPATEQPPKNTNRLLPAFVVVLLVCLAISSFLSPGPEKPAVDGAFTGKPALRVSGISLDQTWDEIDSVRQWDDRQTTILSSYLEDGHLTVRFDADKNLKYIDGHALSLNGQPLFTPGTRIDEVLARFGEPSERGPHGRELTYVYDDAGQKCAVTMAFRDHSGEYDSRTGQEVTERGPQLEKVRLNLAGTRWGDTPSLPILSK